LLHELGLFVHIDFGDCYACNCNKQILVGLCNSLLTTSICIVSQKLSFKFVTGNNKLETQFHHSYSPISISATWINDGWLALRGSSVESFPFRMSPVKTLLALRGWKCISCISTFTQRVSLTCSGFRISIFMPR